MNTVPPIRHRHVKVGTVEVFFRESVPERPDAPVVLLLHGFPSASHQFRRLIDALGSRYRLIAPDYPGFGHTRTPDDFAFTFDRLADVIEGFLETIDVDRFTMYVFDFGAPVGFRLAERHPAWITGLVVQNGNVYEAGLSEAARDFISLRPDIPGAEDAIRNLLTPAGTRSQYETGAAATSLISPDGWTLDQHFLDLPGRTRAQIELAFDYSENLKRYPGWQRWLRRHRPRTLIVWGRFDPFFPESGARAYLRDIPSAELHLLDTGHFALEDELATIAPLIDRFVAGLAPEQCGDKCRCGEETSSEWSASDGCDRIAPLCDPSAPCGPEDATA